MITSTHQLSIRRRYQIAQLFAFIFLCGILLLVSQFGGGTSFLSKRNVLSPLNNSQQQQHHSSVDDAAAPGATSPFTKSFQKFLRKRRKILTSLYSNGNNNNHKNSIITTTTTSIEDSPTLTTSLLQSTADTANNGTKCVEEEEVKPLVWDIFTFLKLGASIILVGLSGLFSGLTLGLLGLDRTTLDVCLSTYVCVMIFSTFYIHKFI